MIRFARLFRTVRHLRPAQVYWRLRYRLQRVRPVAAPRVPDDLRIRDDFPDVPLLRHASESDDCDGKNAVDLLAQGRFGHLHQTRRLGIAPTDWLLGPVAEDRLWTITLHYHAWAWQLAEIVAVGGSDAEQADECLRRLLGYWIENCGLEADGSRDLACSAYAIATRIGWWCRLYHRLGRAGRKNWGPLEAKFIGSLWQQAAFLEKHLEWDLRANHLLRDIVGLAWAGRFFSHPRAEKWLAAATDLALQQADEQVLPDGGHFERSAMYHIHAMEDFLTLGALLEDRSTVSVIRETWHRMAEMLAWMRHPDGQVPLFNDGGFNGAAHPQDMLSAGCRLFDLSVDSRARRGGKLFADFGMAVWHDQRWSVFFDVGEVGVDYQPGHAHADTLSVEASFHGERLFVDPGTFAYDNDHSRRYDRATASHNTLCVDRTNSSEVWHIFRVGRRARPLDVDVQATEQSFRASASHDGYSHLAGRPRHARSVEVTASGRLIITDHIFGRGRHAFQGGLLLAPGWTARENADGWDLFMRDRQLRATIETLSDLKIETQQRTYSPEYGLRHNVQRLACSGTVELPCKMIWRIESCSPHDESSDTKRGTIQ